MNSYSLSNRFTFMPPQTQKGSYEEDKHNKITTNSPIRIVRISALQKQSSYSEDDKKTIKEIWNKRILKSQSYDGQKIEKSQQFSAPILVVLFIVAFCLIFYFTPIQTYHPELK